AWIVLIALLFWVLVTWYSSRVLVYRKPSLYENSKTIGFHAPRLLGFIAFSVGWIAILLIRIPETEHLPTIKNTGTGWLWLAISAVLYFGLYYGLKWWRDVKLVPAMHKRMHKSTAPQNSDQLITAKELHEHKIFTRIYIIAVAVACGIVLFNFFLSRPVVLFYSIILLQLLFLFLVTIRRARLPYQDFPLEAERDKWIRTWKQQKKKWEPGFVGNILYPLNISFRERIFFYSFNIFSIIALFFYARAILDIDYANSIGSLALVLLAFGVLVGFFAFVSVLSVIKKINFHFILLVLVFLLAKTREPHYVRTTNAKAPAYLFATQRPTLAEYFRKWTAQRKEVIEQSSEYPVFFVLGDGGASRSGYWVAAALGKLQDSSQGKFSEHLFCLSGASGGVVGEGAFFSLLHHHNEMTGRSYEKEAKNYLRNDFLSFALARMLGPDFFRPLIPFNLRHVKDRAGALETALERGMHDSVFLKNKLSIPFSVYTGGRNDSVQLPILCINTTRMQDGRPGVISNINIHNVNERDSAFGPRLDVMDFIDTGKDLRLSTALMVGSRFPYVSPAGRIDERIRSRIAGKPDGTRVHYFVDGGYFDNSGAGIVHEMLLELEDIKKVMIAGGNAHLGKLKFYVIHITNNPLGPSPLGEINYLSNDLFSPLITLIGTYTRQTDVNDWRLRKHLQLLYNTVSDTQYYKRIDLYKGINADTLRFPMNWAISGYYREKMDTLLSRSWQTRNLAMWMKTLR
ncbi:MAG: hypothetical protein WCF67_08615, partial [Chitinophagaceae bacterium]